MRVLVTGSRDIVTGSIVYRALFEEHATAPTPLTLVVGDCPTGADFLARHWAEAVTRLGSKVHVEVFTADWDTRGRAAGPERNARMVASGADICLAFYKRGAGNRGTSNCVRLARAAGIPVTESWESV
ncbi:SLOG family protein [Parafrankia sp. EUN1f]|uniref:SLOG family protein n=1 Tax=Parafrankia sp. EUN1f TaxID=102897 RepID=UPI0001C4599F|nr:SLOG family protein [Parafrankia sp. EUN1f]EFC86486.1 conserved hypothetical protein [Parafrankia sp. EUN1f]